MRFVPTIDPAPIRPTTREVKALSAVHAVKPVQVGDAAPTAVAPRLHAQDQARQPGLPVEDRRHACRRIANHKVLLELRSGRDRRQHNLLAGGTVEHIDEQV